MCGHPVYTFCTETSRSLGSEGFRQWESDEIAKDAKTGKILVSIDPRHFRPAEVELLLGDPTKAERDLGWTAKTPLRDLVSEMVQYDLAYDSYGGK